MVSCRVLIIVSCRVFVMFLLMVSCSAFLIVSCRVFLMVSCRVFLIVSCRVFLMVNGQGSVLAPVLFNLYSNDLPVTRGRKFIYADDICLVIQGQYFSELECSLSSDMARMSHFCRQLRLKPTPPKQSAVCSTCIISAPPANCQFIWMASAFGMSATHSPRTFDKKCHHRNNPK